MHRLRASQNPLRAVHGVEIPNSRWWRSGSGLLMDQFLPRRISFPSDRRLLVDVRVVHSVLVVLLGTAMFGAQRQNPSAGR